MSSVKRLAFATAGITGIWIVTFTALLLLGARAVPAAVVAVGVSIAVAILVLLGARWRAQTVAAVEPGRTGRRVLAVSVVATLGVGAFIAIYAAQLIPGNRYLGLFLAQLAFCPGPDRNRRRRCYRLLGCAVAQWLGAAVGREDRSRDGDLLGTHRRPVRPTLCACPGRRVRLGCLSQ
jgi:hypothetical protein